MQCFTVQGSHNFWIQNWRRFPDLFAKQKFLFPNRWRNKAFFMMSCKHTGEIESDLKKKGKKITYKALVVAQSLEKNSRRFFIFSKLHLFSWFFPGLENSWINCKTFVRFQDSVRTLCTLIISEQELLKAKRMATQ